MLTNLAIAPGSINIPASVVPGMFAWYDASQITGLTNGASVASWSDLSGNGNTVSQGTGANQPTYQTAQINGLPAVSFNGTTDQLQTSSFTAQALPLTIFLVDNPTSVTSRVVPFAGGYAGASGFYAGYSGSSHVGMFNGNTAVSGGTVTAGSPNVKTFQFNGASSFARLNGTQVASGNPGTNTLQAIYLGSWVGNNYFQGLIGEVLVYSSALTLAQIQANESYLTAKWLGSGGGGTPQAWAAASAAQQSAVGRAASW